MNAQDPEYTIVGAGPAGLVAALTLARAGKRVRVLEKADRVGHRFKGDFQGLENWSQRLDGLERLARLGVESTFRLRPFHAVSVYDHKLRPTIARTAEPLFYLLSRGPGSGSLDTSLLAQVQRAGVEVRFNSPVRHPIRGAIVSAGPQYAHAVATGYLFQTDLPDQAHCVFAEEVAPAAYAYLLVWDGRATLATCLFADVDRAAEVRRTAVEVFQRLVPGLDLTGARPFSGYGTVFSRAVFSDTVGQLYAGEAAGLQDPEWGFGLWYAMESGWLAARSLLEGFDYAVEASRRFELQRRSGFANRLFFEHIPQAIIPVLVRQVASSSMLRERLRRHWKPNWVKSTIAYAGRSRLRRFTPDREVNGKARRSMPETADRSTPGAILSAPSDGDTI
ncbi:MAG: NAD(P)-binding protein [Actinobacteria bacterium]|nr:NAD(P)-binding protein [Actinomycetota bacterium]